MSVTLTDTQHQAIWRKLILICECVGELRLASETSRVIGLGSLFRQIEDAAALIGSNVADITDALERADSNGATMGDWT